MGITELMERGAVAREGVQRAIAERPAALSAEPQRGRLGGPITPGERHEMISDAAYFTAARRGFRDGGAEGDWYEAEAEIDARLMQPSGRRN